MKKLVTLSSLVLILTLTACSHNSNKKENTFSSTTSYETSTDETDNIITMEESGNIKKMGRYEVYKYIQ